MFSKNLRYYRLKKGLTKRALASMVHVTPMAISHYENGERKPSADTIRALADALDVRALDLFANVDKDLEFVHGAFRRSSHLSAMQQEFIHTSAEEYLNRFYAIVDILGGNVLPEAPAYHQLPLSSDPEEDARALREYLHFPADGPIGGLIATLESRGVLICFLNIQADTFSGTHGLVNGRPYIAVRESMSPEDIRSAIAQELAHVFFQWPEDLGERGRERRAYAISGAFLFPAEDAKRELGLRRTAVAKDMAIPCKKYGISLSLLVQRASQCRIMSSKALRDYRQNAERYRLIQPEITREEPTFFSQLVFRGVCEDDISVRKGAELLQVPYTYVEEQCFWQ